MCSLELFSFRQRYPLVGMVDGWMRRCALGWVGLEGALCVCTFRLGMDTAVWNVVATESKMFRLVKVLFQSLVFEIRLSMNTLHVISHLA